MKYIEKERRDVPCPVLHESHTKSETHLLFAVAHIHSVSNVHGSATHALVPPRVHLEHAYVRDCWKYVRVSVWWW